MPKDSAPPSIARAVWFAAVLSLLVTAIRLWGEQEGWAPAIFSPQPGGGMSPLGIAWLVIPFGFVFGRRLAANGHRPVSTKKALLYPLLAFALTIGVFAASFQLDIEWRPRAIVTNVASVLIGLLAFAAWRRCWFVLAFYGVLARLPVIVVQYVSVERGWNNHFAKGPPNFDPADALFLLTIAQSTFWPFAFTTIVGGFFAALGALTVRRG